MMQEEEDESDFGGKEECDGDSGAAVAAGELSRERLCGGVEGEELFVAELAAAGGGQEDECSGNEDGGEAAQAVYGEEATRVDEDEGHGEFAGWRPAQRFGERFGGAGEQGLQLFGGADDGKNAEGDAQAGEDDEEVR